MQILHARPPLATKLAAGASIVVLALSLALSGCGRHTTNDGTNAGSQPGTTTTGQTQTNTGAGSLTDLQTLSNSITSDLNSAAADENAANQDQTSEDVEVQP
jgi:hypothetical protein